MNNMLIIYFQFIVFSYKNISIEYIYSFIGEKSSKAVIVLKTSDLDLSINVLRENGVNVLSKEDVNNLDYAK